MQGILKEATGNLDDNSVYYDELIASNLLDNESRKRKISILRVLKK